MAAPTYEVFLRHAGGAEDIKPLLGYARLRINNMYPFRNRALVDENDLTTGPFDAAIRAALNTAIVGKASTFEGMPQQKRCSRVCRLDVKAMCSLLVHGWHAKYCAIDRLLSLCGIA